MFRTEDTWQVCKKTLIHFKIVNIASVVQIFFLSESDTQYPEGQLFVKTDVAADQVNATRLLIIHYNWGCTNPTIGLVNTISRYYIYFYPEISATLQLTL